MHERKAITATSATATAATQLLGDHVLDAVVAGMHCSTAAELQNAYYAAGAAVRAAGQGWIASGLENAGGGVVNGACQ